MLGAPQARPPERSGDRGAPRATAKGVRGGEAPRIYKDHWEYLEKVGGLKRMNELKAVQIQGY